MKLELVARDAAKRFTMLFAGVMVCVVAGIAQALTFDEQDCLRGNVASCEAACAENPAYCNLGDDEDYSAPAVLTETETSVGCNPWVEGNIAENAAKDKLRPKLIAYPGVEYDFRGCQYLGTVRVILGVPIAIFDDYVTHACPKNLNWNAGLSDIGRMYTMAARCIARRVDY